MLVINQEKQVSQLKLNKITQIDRENQNLALERCKAQQSIPQVSDNAQAFSYTWLTLNNKN
jgi:hypothetical protein